LSAFVVDLQMTEHGQAESIFVHLMNNFVCVILKYTAI